MDDYEDLSLSFTILPGVDLALWLRIVVCVVLMSVAGALTLALR